MLKYALLGFLDYQPYTGYELKQMMDLSTANFWHAKQSQIYMTLKKLETEKLVTSEIEPQEGRPNRRVYTITGAGREDLQSWLSKPITRLEPHKETLLLQLFFSARQDKETLLTQLRLLRDLHQQQVEHYKTETKAVVQQFAASTGLEKDALLWDATRRFGEQYESMTVHWLDETIAMIEAEF
jgi:PadR family transcriptional regulator AphA